jgi:hypothetical protein
MSHLSAQLNKIASDRMTAGKQDALLSLAALVLLDKNNDVQLDGDDLPGTVSRLFASSPGIPRTDKYSVSLAQLKALGGVSTGILNLGPISPNTVVLFSQLKHSAAFATVPGPASNTLISDNTAPADGDTVTIGTKVYTFKTALTPTEGEVLIGGSADASLLNLIRAINHTGTPNTDYKCAAAHPLVTAAPAVTAHAFAVTAKTPGTGGNSIATTETSTHLSWGPATLTGGVADLLSAATVQIILHNNDNVFGDTEYAPALSVLLPVDNATYQNPNMSPQDVSPPFNTEHTLQAQVVLTGANFNALTAGAFDFWLTHYVRP